MKNTPALLAASLGCLFVSMLTLVASPSQAAPASVSLVAAPLVRLPGHMLPGALRRSALLGRKNGAENVSLALVLPLRDPAGLDRLLQRLYSPGDPLFHHFITSREFADRFSPTPQTYDAVAAFARAGGLEVTGTHPNRLLLEVAGPTRSVESAFHVHLQNYAAEDGLVFHAPDAEPAIPAAMVGKINGVVGLQNSGVWHPHLSRPRIQPAGIGSDPDGGLTPRDIKAAYNLSQTTLTGAGRTLGLMELDSYTPSDITSYESAYRLPAVPLHNVLVGGAVDTPGNGAGEVTLDIELMIALAPSASAIRVYEAPNSGAGILGCYSQIADDNIAKEVSTSWGITENNTGSAFSNAENTVFQQMATQGQSLFAASGDSGAYDNGLNLTVDDPASQPYVTGVGGTTLGVVAAGGAYRAESAWGDRLSGTGGGGGISDVWPQPSYQNGVAGLASTTQRNVPDISLDADPNTGYSIYYSDPIYGTGFYVYGGTSCAAPLWAAFTALVNQQRQTNGEADFGFANPGIYRIAGGAGYLTGFHDIADGSTNLYYAAQSGYDNATGWGSFNGANLLTLFAPTVVAGANPLSALTVTPASVVGGLNAKGTVVLSSPAPVGGATVALSAGTGPVTVPATVVVTAGSLSADFPITTSPVTASTAASVTAVYSGGSLTAPLTVLPAPVTITPLSLSLDMDSVGGGSPAHGTVALSGPAPSGGLTITLTSDAAAAIVPATLSVPAGAVSGTFTIMTVPVAANVTAHLGASLNGTQVTASLTVLAPALEPITLTPPVVAGGTSVAAGLTLTLPAPAGGSVITLTSSSPAAVVPGSITIPAGQTTVPVTVTTTGVSATTVATITATYAGVSERATLTIKAAVLTGLTLAPATVVGGSTSIGTLTFSSAAPANLTATLTSSDPAALLPAALAVPAGATSASFVIPTSTVSSAVAAAITVKIGSATESATLLIQPVQVAALELSPALVVTGTSSTAKLTLNAAAPAGGLTVMLTSSAPAATVPATLLIPAGATTATFPVATPHAGSAVISAHLGGAAQTAALTVSGAPGTTYPAGLNLLSAPYDYSGVPLDGLFGYSGVVLGTWQPETAAYALTPNAPADALHIGHGYWVNLPTAVTLSSVGTPADPTQDFAIALSPGWNQIGQPWTAGETLSSLNVSAGGAAVPFDQATTAAPLLISSLVYRYAPLQGSTAGHYVWVRNSDSLQPGLGYWVYAYSAVTLIVPHH